MFENNNKILRLSLKKKLLVGFVVIPIISMMFIFIIYGIKTKNIIMKNIDHYSVEVLKLIEKNIYSSIELFDTQLDEILMSPLIQEGLQNAKTMTIQDKRKFVNDFDNFLKTKIYLLSSVGEVEIVTKDLSILYTQGFKYFKREDIETYSVISEEKSGTTWFHTEISGAGTVAMVRPIKDLKTHMVNGYIFVAISETVFAKSVLAVDLGEDITMNIFDFNNHYLFGQHSKNFDLGYREWVNLNYDVIKIDEKRYIKKDLPIDKLDWNIVTLIPYNGVAKDIFNTIIGLLVLGILFMIMVLLTTKHMYFAIYNPLKRLILGVNLAIDGDFSNKIDVTSEDEIGVLSKQFNALIDKINLLINEVKHEQKLKRESEIKMLQAQINPHFLFNTLNTLKWIAIMNNDKSVANGLSALAKLLRNTIIDSNECITVREEIENVKNYIIIQKLRYGDSFDVNYHISDEIYKRKIVKFILQPIIENCIIHGFDEESENQIIDIYITEKENDFYIMIEDNGKGFNVDNVDNVGSKEGKLSGIGYRNVKERIRLTYGDEYKISIGSKVGQGTIVSMRLRSDI